MKFTTAFYTLALSFAAVTGSANARIGQQMSSDAFESRMMSGTQDCEDSCCGGLICDPHSATACGGELPQCEFTTCDLQHPSGKYRCEPSGGRKLGGDQNSTPGSDNAPIGQQMSPDDFECASIGDDVNDPTKFSKVPASCCTGADAVLQDGKYLCPCHKMNICYGCALSGFDVYDPTQFSKVPASCCTGAAAVKQDGKFLCP